MKPPARDFTTADLANVRWFHRLFHGKKHQTSVLDQIRAADTPAEINALLSGPISALASSGTKRKWTRVAEARLAAIRAKAIRA